MDCYYDAGFVKIISGRFEAGSMSPYWRGYYAGLSKARSQFNIKEVIFNDPATIVYWEDGTKTVVKCHNETFDEEKGLAMAIAKKAFDNKGNYNEVFKKYVPEKEDTKIIQ